MTLSTMTLPSMTTDDIERQSTMLQKMRDLAKQVKSAADLTTTHSMDWSSVPRLDSIIGSESLTGSSIPWTIATNNTGPAPSLQGPVTYGGAGIIGNGTYTTNTTGLNQGNVSIANTQFEQSGKMVMRGKEADIEINGKSMSAWMEKVEQRLNILTPNPELEKDWDDLRRLGERYRKLEKKCKEKAQMWEALKKLPKVKV
jgi:hypothetical protein